MSLHPRSRPTSSAVSLAFEPLEPRRMLAATLGGVTVKSDSGAVESFGIFLPGDYRVVYDKGAVDWTGLPANDWTVNYPLYGVYTFRIKHTNSAGETETIAPGTSRTFATAGEAQTDSAGKNVVFAHAGGPIGVYMYDTDYTNNNGSVSWTLERFVPNVSISAPDSAAAESGEPARNPGVFTLTIDRAPAADLPVAYTLAGTADNGVDYEIRNGVATILAGKFSATIDIKPKDDEIAEQSETVTATVLGDVQERYTVIPPNNTATLSIADNEPTVSVTASAQAAEQNRTPGSFTFTRSGGDLSKALNVTYSVGGSADAPADYAPLTGVARFEPYFSSVPAAVVPADDSIVEGNETVGVTISNSPFFNAGTTIASLLIADNDVPPPPPPKVNSVTWETFKIAPTTLPATQPATQPLENIPLDTDPINDGLRIFPEKRTPDDQLLAQRRKVAVKAQLDRAEAGVRIYLQIYDADDPSASSPALDPAKDSRGRETGIDNRLPGQDNVRLDALSDINGLATFEFTVSAQPGNNFKAFASTTSFAPGLTFAQMDGYDELPAGTKTSPLLTVWRKLHVERDSMAAPGAGDGPFDGPHTAQNQGNDDVHPGETGPEITAADLDRIKTGYRAAFIEVVDDLTELNVKGEAPFVRHLASDDALATGNAVRDVPSAADFWVVQLFAAYEPAAARDGDLVPIDDGPPIFGFAPDAGKNDGPAIVFTEVIRDQTSRGDTRLGGDTVTTAKRRQLTAFHESVHRFNLLHEIPPKNPPGPGDQGPLREGSGDLEPNGQGGFQPYDDRLDDLLPVQLEPIRRATQPK